MRLSRLEEKRLKEIEIWQEEYINKKQNRLGKK